MRRIGMICLLAGVGGLSLAAADAVKTVRPAAEVAVPEGTVPDAAPRSPRHGGQNRMFWRVFATMSSEERREMMELQMRDPAAYKEEMNRRAGELRKAEEIRQKKIEDLVSRCKTGSQEESASAKEELTGIFRDGYRKRLEDGRRHLEEMRRRLDKLDESLKAKEAGEDAEVRSMVDKHIRSGGRPPERPARRGMPPEMLPPPPPGPPAE